MNEKSVKLMWLRLQNFKGIQSLSLDFQQHETFIHAKNRGGKTTIFDAFTWLLFGKNSEDDTDFSIKTIGSDGQPLHYLDHEVSAGLSVNGTTIELRKLYKEDWVKKRGSAIEELKGHSTEYFWNDAPITMKEYKQRISEILDEQVFKMVTNPLYFNSLKWEERRKILQQIAGNITDELIAAERPEFATLLQDITGMTTKMYKDSLSKKILRLKEEIIQIPARVSEAQRNMPVSTDWTTIQAELSSLENKKAAAQQNLLDVQKRNEQVNSKVNEAYRQKMQLQRDLDSLAAERSRTKDNAILALISEKNKLERHINELQSAKLSAQKERDKLTELISGLERRNAQLREEYAKVETEQPKIADDEFTCSSCGQALPEDKATSRMEDAIKRHNQKRAFQVEQINAEGIANKRKIEEMKSKFAELSNFDEGQIEKATAEIANILNQIDLLKNQDEIPSAKELELKDSIDNFIIPEPEQSFDTSAQMQEIAAIDSAIQERKIALSKKDDIDAVKKRIDELKSQERSIAQDIAELQGKQMMLEDFEKTKSAMIEDSVNGMFKFVKFKLFEYQLNGGEAATCVCLINGVPFSDANTESKINSGLDIINTLSSFYKVSAPIFIDNRESVTSLIETSSQIVNLVVDPNYLTPTIVKQ